MAVTPLGPGVLYPTTILYGVERTRTDPPESGRLAGVETRPRRVRLCILYYTVAVYYRSSLDAPSSLYVSLLYSTPLFILRKAVRGTAYRYVFQGSVARLHQHGCAALGLTLRIPSRYGRGNVKARTSKKAHARAQQHSQRCVWGGERARGAQTGWGYRLGCHSWDATAPQCAGGSPTACPIAGIGRQRGSVYS